MRALKWSLEPVIVPRWMLVIKYTLFLALGIVLAIAGSPSIAEATSEGYLAWYGTMLAGSALIALVGCVIDREPTEMVGALLMWCLLLVYVGAVSGRIFEGDLGTTAITLIVLMVSMLPMARGFSILSRTVKTWAFRRKERA